MKDDLLYKVEVKELRWEYGIPTQWEIGIIPVKEEKVTDWGDHMLCADYKSAVTLAGDIEKDFQENLKEREYSYVVYFDDGFEETTAIHVGKNPREVLEKVVEQENVEKLRQNGVKTLLIGIFDDCKWYTDAIYIS